MNEPLKVSGYTSQSDKNVALVNENKTLEEMVMRQIDNHVRNQDSPNIDQRMVALARTKTQEAFMWLNRAVFKPTRILELNSEEVEDLKVKLG